MVIPIVTGWNKSIFYMLRIHLSLIPVFVKQQ